MDIIRHLIYMSPQNFGHHVFLQIFLFIHVTNEITLREPTKFCMLTNIESPFIKAIAHFLKMYMVIII